MKQEENKVAVDNAIKKHNEYSEKNLRLKTKEELAIEKDLKKLEEGKKEKEKNHSLPLLVKHRQISKGMVGLKKGEEVKFGQTEFKYLDLSTLLVRLHPLLEKYNCSISFDEIQLKNPGDDEYGVSSSDNTFMEIKLFDLNNIPKVGNFFEGINIMTSKKKMVLDTQQKNRVQAYGSTNTYTRRYLLECFFGMVGDMTNDPDRNMGK